MEYVMKLRLFNRVESGEEMTEENPLWRDMHDALDLRKEVGP